MNAPARIHQTASTPVPVANDKTPEPDYLEMLAMDAEQAKQRYLAALKKKQSEHEPR